MSAKEPQNGSTPSVPAPHPPSIQEVSQRITDTFQKIGTERMPTTVIPAGNKNTSRIAGLYFVADQLRSLANTRFKECEVEAREAGILGDPKEYVEGKAVTTWSSTDFTIVAKQSKPRNLLDKDRLLAELIKHVGEKKAHDILKAAMKKGKGATTIFTAMK